MGDAAGIGPEIIAKALSTKDIYDICDPIVIGDAEVMKKSVDIAKVILKIRPVQSINEAKFQYRIVDVLDLGNLNAKEIKMGRISTRAGKASVEYVQKAVQLASEGKIHAIATAPINKEAMNRAGYKYSGHTDLLASLTNTKDYAMMLITESLKVTHVTTHMSLRDACNSIKKERVLKVIMLTYRALQDMGIRQPRIAVASLNPHAGEGGLFGNEEEKEISPAIQAAKKTGIDVNGPMPADTIFVKARGGAFDAVVAMYHDQGHIPVKLAGLEWNEPDKKWVAVGGVNMTIGLPIIRTSVDHGTAYGKAGKGTANPQSMIEAVRLASRMVKLKQAAKGYKSSLQPAHSAR